MTLVGRKESCDFRVDEEGVAEMHCVFALTDDLVLLRDLETGRTHVNGQAVRRAVLLENDLLRIGESRFWVRYEKG
jgi:pSer/pThr/pTyr-binding forkhead associated (FHA) protein